MMRPLVPVLLLVVLALAGCSSSENSPASAAPEAPIADPRVPAGLDVTLPGNATWIDATELDVAGIGFPVFQPVPVEIANWTGRELSLAIDPNDPTRMIACSPTGTIVVGDNHSDVFLSLDGGATWQAIDPEPGGDTRDYTSEGGDCDVAIGPDGTIVLVDTWLANLSVGTSSDGTSWSGTAITVTAPIVDRPWLAIDGTGTIHITYQAVQAFLPSMIWYTQSTDGGATFRPAVPVATAAHVDGAGTSGLFTWTGNLVVSHDGQTLHSIYTRRMVPVLSDQESAGTEVVMKATSTDGGLTWSTRNISPNRGPASWLYPSIARDGQGVLYAVWSEYREIDQPVFWTRSFDDGNTWSHPQPLHAGQLLRTGAPWVDAGASGAVIQFTGTPDVNKPRESQRWWIYWATLTGDEVEAAPRFGTTSVDPIYTGYLFSFPEYNTVRVDNEGRAHIAAVAWVDDAGRTGWRPYYIRQLGGPLLAGPDPA